jgi:hypothetical protein
VPRRGYRFVARLEETPVEASPPKAPASGAQPTDAPPTGVTAGRKRTLLILLAIVVSAVLLGLGVLLGHRTARLQPPDFQRLTVQHGTVYSARFAPDGHNVIYAASWDGAPIEIFSIDLKITGARNMELPAT